MATVALLGSSGFVGQHTARALREDGVGVIALPSVRLLPSPDRVRVGSSVLRRAEAVELLSETAAGATSVVNAAGSATPRASHSQDLFLGNAVLPAFVHEVTRAAGIARLVHVSSAVVQGRRETLDETPAVDPGTPYGRSKAEGERRLLEAEDGPQVTIYRPTSVMSLERGMTRGLVGLTRIPILPLIDGGMAPVPVAHIDNVAAALVHLSTTPNDIGPIVLHPWEGHSVLSLLRALGWPGRPVPLPRRPVNALFDLGWNLASPLPSARGRLRAVELLVAGQRQHAEALLGDGFSLRITADGYAGLGQAA